LAAEPNAPFARIFAIPLMYKALVVLTDERTEVDLTVRKDVDPNRTKITRFVEVPKNWGPGALPGKKERVKRKREYGDEDAEARRDTHIKHAKESDLS